MVVKNPGFGIREMWIQNTALKKKKNPSSPDTSFVT